MVQRNKKKKKSKSKKIFKVVFTILLFLFLFTGITFAGVILAIIKTAPALDINAILSLNEVSVIYDNKGNYMDNVPTDERRSIISINDMPENLKNAFISIEDERFREHKGIDVKRIFGAVYIDVKNKLTGKSGLHGASTITQQLLKNTMLSPDVSIPRKVKEIYLALQLEKKLNKDQILEAYLNTIFLGGRANGVEVASKQYFDKSAKDLNLIESAYLAGMNQSPSIYYPFSASSKKDPSKYINRTKTVLGKMIENGHINQEEYDKAIADLDNGELKFIPPNFSDKLNYEWFSRPAMTRVKKDLKAQYGYSDKEVNRLLIYGGIKIYTTMDKDLQDYSQDILNNASKYISIKEFKDKNGLIQPQAAAVIMDYHTGEVKTIIGGRGEQAALSFNRGASDNVLRSTGSAIKPLTVYAPAIDLKLASASTVVNDSPLPDEMLKKYSYNFQPKNVTNDYKGPVTLRTALTYSINTIALKTEDYIGLKNGIAYGEKFGLKFNSRSKTSIAALALGEFDNDPKDLDGSNPLYMAAAYGTFGNNGIYTEPILYTKVVDRNGKVLLEKKPDQRKVLNPQTAYIMYDLLQGPVKYYSGSNAKFGNMPVAGKTGTSELNKNLWFSGLTPYMSAAVWIGNDIPEEIKSAANGESYSGSTAGILWGKIMGKAHEGLEVKEIEMPNSVVKSKVCLDSGKIATDLCNKDPRGNRIIEDYFIEGSIPSALCDVHIEVKVNKLNGKVATENTPKELVESRVYIKKEFAGSVTDKNLIEPTEVDDYKAPVQNPDNNAQDNKNPSDNKGNPNNNGNGENNKDKPGSNGNNNENPKPPNPNKPNP